VISARHAVVPGALALAAVAGALLMARRAAATIDRQPDPLRDHDLGPLAWPARTVTSHDGTVLHVVERGEGPAVVLTHGFVADTSTWSLVGPMLVARGFRVIAYDHRGHGQSAAAGSAGYGFEAWAADLMAVVESSGVDDATVVGHSMGGIGILAAAHADPERFARHVGSAVFAASLAQGPGRPRWVGIKPHARTVMRYEFWRRQRTVGVAVAGRALGVERPASVVESVWRAHGRTPVTTIDGAGAWLLTFDASDMAASVTVPSIVLVGTHDRITPEPVARELAATLPAAELRVLPGVGHAIALEAPEALVAAIEHARKQSERTT
jgi:pimeloyl-ACP methyl ester carboxylesterase